MIESILRNFDAMSWWESMTLFYVFMIWVISTLKFVNYTKKTLEERKEKQKK